MQSTFWKTFTKDTFLFIDGDLTTASIGTTRCSEIFSSLSRNGLLPPSAGSKRSSTRRASCGRTGRGTKRSFCTEKQKIGKEGQSSYLPGPTRCWHTVAAKV